MFLTPHPTSGLIVAGNAQEPLGLLPGEQPEQLKFVMGKAGYFSIHNFISQEKNLKNGQRGVTLQVYYIFGNVCKRVCMFAIGACTIRATELKFGTELGFHPGKVLAYVWIGRTPSPGRGRPKSASGGPCSPNGAFLGRLHKTKVAEHHQFCQSRSGQIRSRTSPRGLTKLGSLLQNSSYALGPNFT